MEKNVWLLRKELKYQKLPLFPLVVSESGLELPAEWRITKKADTMELYKHNNKGDHRHYHQGA